MTFKIPLLKQLVMLSLKMSSSYFRPLSGGLDLFYSHLILSEYRLAITHDSKKAIYAFALFRPSVSPSIHQSVSLSVCLSMKYVLHHYSKTTAWTRVYYNCIFIYSRYCVLAACHFTLHIWAL